MAKFIKHIFDALSLETLYKYVLNSCVCRSECCSETNGCLCQCHSNEIQHHEDDDDFIGCMKICCGSSAVPKEYRKQQSRLYQPTLVHCAD